MIPGWRGSIIVATGVDIVTMATYLEVFGVVAVLEWGETSTLGRVAGTTFLSRILMDPILSTLYSESSPLEEGEEHPDMVSTSDSYPSLWCSITSMCVCVCACGVYVRVCVCYQAESHPYAVDRHSPM